MNNKHTISRYKEYSFIAVLFAAAVISRFYGLGIWPVEGDEVLTYSRSLRDTYSLKFPGTYFLVSLFFKSFGVSEFTLRLPSAIFGIFSIPVFYLITKNIFDKITALTGTLFLLFSSYHLYHCQYARFYSAIFFWAVCAYFFYFRYFQTNDIKFLLGALIRRFR